MEIHTPHQFIRTFFTTLIALTIFLGNNVTEAVAAASAHNPQQENAQQESPQLTSALPTTPPNQLIIGLKSDISDKALQTLLATHGLRLKKRWPLFHGALVEFDDEDSDTRGRRRPNSQAGSALEQTRIVLESLPEIRYASYNETIQLGASSAAQFAAPAQRTDEPHPLAEPAPNDPLFDVQWALQTVRAVDAWNITHGDPNVVVAMIDTGYDFDHPDLSDQSIWTNQVEAQGVAGVDDDGNGYVDDIRGWDFANNDNILDDDTGHGTGVGGIIIATTNNATGISGVGRNVRLLPLKVLDGSLGTGSASDLIDAFAYIATIDEVQIVNLSFAIDRDMQIVEDAVEELSQTKLLIAASGNMGWTHAEWPAAYPNVVAVTATDRDDLFGAFSSRGPEIDLAAPGVKTLTTDSQNQYNPAAQGTSFAAPHVSALAALLVSLRPDFSNAQIEAIMESSAADVNSHDYPGYDEFIGHGRIDNLQALLDASAGLQIAAVGTLQTTAYADTRAEYNIQVQTPASPTQNPYPIRNAVLYYDLSIISGTSTPVVTPIQSRILTDENGLAAIAFTAPTFAGEYLLTVQVGQERVTYPLTVVQPQVYAGISVGTSSLRVGDGSAEIRINAFDANGALLSTALPLQLEVDLGYFGVTPNNGTPNNGTPNNENAPSSGPRVLEAVMRNGVYVAKLYAGAEAGHATVRASIVGAVPLETQVVINAGEPATLDLFSEQMTLQPSPTDTEVEVTILVKDTYGNLLDTPYYVKLTSSTGEIAPLVHHAAGTKPLTALLKIPANTKAPIKVWAIVEGTRLIESYTIEVEGGDAEEEVLEHDSTVLLPIVRR